jgi:hypothetical protein
VGDTIAIFGCTDKRSWITCTQKPEPGTLVRELSTIADLWRAKPARLLGTDQSSQQDERDYL